VATTRLSPTALAGRALATDLDRRLAHVLEPAMRRRLVAEALGAAAPEAVCALLAWVEERPPSSGGSLHDPLRDCLHALLSESDPERGLSYALRRDVHAAAHAAGEETVMALLRSMPPPPTDERPRLPRELDEIPLGRRRSLARGEDLPMLELLARDLDPVVIRHVLRNPRVRESEVVRMAAATPNLPTTLEEIAASPRWARNARVRTAVARNPLCPLPLAARLVPELPRAELREMREDPRLLAAARDLARRELRRRP